MVLLPTSPSSTHRGAADFVQEFRECHACQGGGTTVRYSFAMPLLFTSSLFATDVHFGPTPIAATETARMIAYCDGSVAPTPCLITFEFRSPGGSLLFSDTRTIQPGAAGFADLPAARAGIGRGLGEIDPCWDIQR